MAALYGSFAVVCAGILKMKSPPNLFIGGDPPVSPAVSCVINLSVQYFVVYLLVAVAKTVQQLKGETSNKAVDVLQLAAYTVNFAPMLCILFISARIRALQIDPTDGNPQPWAQACFYMCTYSVLVQTALVIAIPAICGGKVLKGESEGDITFEHKNGPLSMLLDCVRWIAMVCLYGGFTAIIVSVLLIE